MNFIERVKEILLKNNEEELAVIEEKLKDIKSAYDIENESVQRLKEEAAVANKEKSMVQRNILNKKELKELEVIYEFIANYPQIKKIVDSLQNASMAANYAREVSGIYEDEELMFLAEREYRYKLRNIMSNLNVEISKILEESEERYEQNDDKSADDNSPKTEVKKKGFFAKLFGKKEKSPDESKETVVTKNKNPFYEYRRVLNEYKECCTDFLFVTFDKPTIVDRTVSTQIMASLNSIWGAEKRGFELEDADIEYLDYMEPHDLWKEISKYYVNMNDIMPIIQNFAANVDKFEELYKNSPELFDIKNLERIFEENDQLVVDLRSKNKITANKNNEVFREKEKEKEIREQVRAQEAKKKKALERKQKIQNAKTLKDLGYKNKEDAAKKLGMETKDYVVIPIPYTVQSLSALFNNEKRLKVDVDNKTFYATYSNDVAEGKINSFTESKDINAVLLVPISELKKEDIDTVKSGKVVLNSSVLKKENLVLIKQEGRALALEDANVEVQNASKGKFGKYVKEFLGDDYVVDSDEIENYDVFKNIPNISSKEKKLKKEAVKRCVFENLKRDVLSTDTILVNGKTFFINNEDEKELQSMSTTLALDENKLLDIADRIEEFLIEDGKSHAKIDAFYKELLMEYLRVNRKAKAEYYDEDNTLVNLNGKEISIKPILPAKDETIAKRYTRPKEDIVYKTMKLAALANKFAHLSENENIQEAFFVVKHDLIESAIDLAKNRPDIKIKKLFDKNKMVNSVVAEVPGYNMIALHIKNAENSLSYKANRLDEAEDEVLQSSTILMPGVNRELLTTMKKMTEEERGQFLIDMEPTTFYKLALRMGYTTDKFVSDSQRKSFIKKMISSKNIDELLKENEDLEK